MQESDFDLAHAQVIPQNEAKKHAVILIALLAVFIVVLGLVLMLLVKKRKLATKKQAAMTKLSPTPTPTPWKKQIIGFLPSWIAATNSQPNVNRLTQIIFFDLVASPSGQIVKKNRDGTPAAGWDYLQSKAMKNLQKQAKAAGAKVLVTVSNLNSREIESLITDKKAVDRLIDEIVELVRNYKLDGVNVDFEYFTDSHFKAVREMNTFLQNLALALKKENHQLVVSFDVNALSVLIDGNYDMAKIGEVMDQVILMAYDYYRPTSSTAGPVAPLYAAENENSVSKSLQSLIGRVPTEKIILAVPFYGYEWQTVDETFKSKVIPDTGTIATYERIQDLITNRKDVLLKRDEASFSPRLIYRQSGAIKQIYFEDEISLGKKLEFAKEKKLGGVAIWALGYEGDYQDLWKIIEEKMNP